MSDSHMGNLTLNTINLDFVGFNLSVNRHKMLKSTETNRVG